MKTLPAFLVVLVVKGRTLWKVVTWRRGGLLAALFCIVLAPSSARAQVLVPVAPHVAVQLNYIRGQGTERFCGDESELRSNFGADFGYDIVQPDATSLLTVVITRGPGRSLQATMELRDKAGQVTWKDSKVTQNNDCVTLLSGVSLSVELSLDKFEYSPKQPAPPPEPAPAPSAKPLPSPTPAPPPKPEPPAPVPAPDNRAQLRVGIDAGFAMNASPEVSLGLALQGGVRWNPVSLSLELRGDVPTSNDEDFSTWRLAVSGVPCAHIKMFIGCLVTTVGAQFASNETKRLDDSFIGIGARVGVESPLAGRFALRLSADLVGTVPLIVNVDHVNRWDAEVFASFNGGIVADFL